MVPLSGLVMKENGSVVESVRNLDAKCEVQGLLALFAADAKNIKLFYALQSSQWLNIWCL